MWCVKLLGPLWTCGELTSLHQNKCQKVNLHLSIDSTLFGVLFSNTTTFRIIWTELKQNYSNAYMRHPYSHKADNPKHHDVVTLVNSFYGAVISTDKMSSHCKHCWSHDRNCHAFVIPNKLSIYSQADIKGRFETLQGNLGHNSPANQRKLQPVSTVKKHCVSASLLHTHKHTLLSAVIHSMAESFVVFYTFCNSSTLCAASQLLYCTQ